MTEAEWLAATDPTPMLEFLRGKASDRKLRLFAVACCARVCDLLQRKPSRDALEVAERFADGGASKERLIRAYGATIKTYRSLYQLSGSSKEYAATVAVESLCRDPVQAAVTSERVGKIVRTPAEPVRQCSLLRDTFGNPFRPLTPDPSWLTPTVTTLARQMYDTRDFSLMPILADALQDAGCDNADVLGHCRGPGPHVRGCWVVDLVLGKS